MRLLRLLVLSAVASLAVAPLAGATAVERFSVGSDPEARGWSRGLHVVLSSPAEYERAYVGRGGNDGQWTGPEYWATLSRSLGGRATIDWGVDIARAAGAAAAVRAGWVHDWPEIEQGTEAIERTVGGRPAGAIAGTWILSRADYANDLAQYEGAVAFGVCGRWAVVRISTLLPSGDSAGGSMGYGDYLVNGAVEPSVWNRERLLDSIRAVRLEGNLPAARVSAARRGRAVAGAARDCFGAPLARVQVTLERRAGRRWVKAGTGRTSVTGSYSIAARTPGLYRAAVGGRRSAPVGVR